MYSVLLDALTRRAIELEIATSAAPPEGFSWLALGSQARREAVPGSDLDSAIAWYGEVGEQEIRPRLHALAESVTTHLGGWGLPIDSHGATASDVVFVRSAESWQKLARSWIERPTQEKALILVSLLLDSRPIWGIHQGAADRRDVPHGGRPSSAGATAGAPGTGAQAADGVPAGACARA